MTRTQQQTGGKEAGQNAPAAGLRLVEENATMKQYRYYSDSLSRNMVRSVKRHLPKIGAPLAVRGICHGKGSGWYEVIVRGTLGKLVLRGCSWGYGGEGPHATRDVLVELGVQPGVADDVAFRTANSDVGQGGTVRTKRGTFRGASVGKEYFTVNLETGVATISPRA